MTRKFLLVLLLIVSFWFGGLLWFAGQLPQGLADSTTKVEAIVVLTGGIGRLQRGLDLLEADLGEKLFVSGVYRGVEVNELLKLSKAAPEELECCIALGYEADNTRGNAVETAQWLSDEGFNSIRLVTASYHMPRSLLEFRQVMPSLRIIANPVFSDNYHQDDWWLWPGSAKLLVSEFNKYIIALARQKLRGSSD